MSVSWEVGGQIPADLAALTRRGKGEEHIMMLVLQVNELHMNSRLRILRIS
jgi:hypothetical protein